jgi:hypothetical protein
VRSGGVDFENPLGNEKTQVLLLLGDLRVRLVLDTADDLVTLIERLYRSVRFATAPVLQGLLVYVKSVVDAFLVSVVFFLRGNLILGFQLA